MFYQHHFRKQLYYDGWGRGCEADLLMRLRMRNICYWHNSANVTKAYFHRIKLQ